MATANDAPGLIDTDILIDGARKLPSAVAYLTMRQAEAPIRISVISAMELVSGCRDKRELEEVQRFLTPIDVIPICERISRAAWELVVSFRLSHGLLLPDAFIAATAREHGLTLNTRNTRHFEMIPDLVVVRPY